jgi:hypothetical protein
MSAYLDFAATDRPSDPREFQDDSLRRIGEILPLVLAKYEIGCHDRNPEVALESAGASGD